MASSLEKLLSIVSSTLSKEGTVDKVKVRFKTFRRSRFLKKANHDIAMFYADGNYAEVIDKLNQCASFLDSDTIKVSAVENIAKDYGKNLSYKADAIRAVSALPCFEIYESVLCHTALYEAFPEKVFVTEELYSRYENIKSKVNSVMNTLRTRCIDKGIGTTFNEKIKEIDKVVVNYNGLIEVLK